MSYSRRRCVIGSGLVAVAEPQGAGMVRALTQALKLWSWGGLACDLVVLNGEPASYLMPLQQELWALRERYAADTAATLPARTGALRVLQAEELSAIEQAGCQPSRISVAEHLRNGVSTAALS